LASRRQRERARNILSTQDDNTEKLQNFRNPRTFQIGDERSRRHQRAKEEGCVQQILTLFFLLPDRKGADFANPPFLFEGQNVNFFFQCVKHSEAGEYFVCITGVFIDTDPADPVEVRRLRSSPKCFPPLLFFLGF